MLSKGNNLIKKDVRNILLIQLGDIGDVVLSFPIIRALRKNFPHSSLIVAVREKAKELIEDCPWATDVISVNKKKRKLYQEIVYQKNFFLRLRKYNFDVAIDLRTGTRDAILVLLSGARLRIGFYSLDGKLWRNKVYTHLHKLGIKIGGWHFVEYYQDILKVFNLTIENIWPELDVPLYRQQCVSELFRKEGIPIDHPVIAVQPFSLWSYKEWGIDKYIQLIKWINTEYELSVIITGSPEERTRADQIRKRCGGNVFNFAGKTSIGAFTALLKACDLFVGGDSSGMHIAAAVGTPTVSIFGPSSAFALAPKGDGHCVVQKELPCVPCNEKGCEGDETSRCLEELTIDEVIPVVKEQIESLLLKTKHLVR
ncbi:glycosyltransferase family 9 protein [Thermodesulfobacteriota bacterium]